jgi:hypothetical protein
MADTSSHDGTSPSSSITVLITVLSIKPVKFGQIFALASVEIDIDGVVLVIHGIRAMRGQPMGTRVDLPQLQSWHFVKRLPLTAVAPRRPPTRLPGGGRDLCRHGHRPSPV